MLLGGCALQNLRLPPLESSQSPLEFYVMASSASTTRREQMWKDLRDQRGEDAELKSALLQSLPGHSGYNASKARKRLQGIARRSSGDARALARVRIAELNSASECRASVQDLQKRLDKIVDIERSLDGHGHAAPSNPAR